MSNKMDCLGCNSYTSAIFEAYSNGNPCPYCGLPADVTHQVLEARKRGADEDLIQRFQAAETRAAKAEEELAGLKMHLEAIKQAVANPPERPSW